MLITFVEPLLTGCSSDKKVIITTGFKADEIMRIGNESCSTGEALLYLSDTKREYTEVYGSGIWSVSTNGVYVGDDIKDMVLNRIIKIKIMNLMAADLNIELEHEAKKLVEGDAKNYYDSMKSLDSNLAKEISLADVKEYFLNKAIAELLYQELTNDVNVEISDDEARTVVIKLIHIGYGANDTDKVDAYEKASQAIGQLTEGASFEKMIAEYSDMPEETLYYQKGDMDVSLESSAFELGKDEFSSILEGQDGYYILYCVNPNDLSVTDITKSEIINGRKVEAFNKKYQDYYAGVQYFINEELWDSLEY